MNYVEPRQRAIDKCWDWTTRRDEQVWATGACRAEGPCSHATADEARAHQTAWMRTRLAAGRRELRPVTRPGDVVHGCAAPDCAAVATHALDAGGWDCHTVCTVHSEDLSWYEASDRIHS